MYMRGANKSPLDLLGVSAVIGRVSVDRKRRAGRRKRGRAGHPVAEAVGVHREGAVGQPSDVRRRPCLGREVFREPQTHVPE